MLEPDGRELLLDALRPPTGYRLDIAVGTTFTLDLQALLLAPLSFAFFEAATAEGEETAGPDPVALLAALREASERMHIFCQAGRIAVPRQYRRVMALLEGTVHGVAAPTSGMIFHPKLWTLRFTTPGDRPCYRLVSLSRNLTFDRCWDTLVRLEGVASDEPVEGAEPLGRFVRALPSLAVRPIHPHALADIDALAGELARVMWEPPPPFRSVQFHDLGLDDVAHRPFDGRADRILVISPFLGAGALRRLAPQATERILVSRPESLDAVGSSALAGYAQTFVMAPPAEGAEPEGNQTIAADGDLNGPLPLSGLHAKVYVADAGWDARVMTGSANATDAALGGNVEFLVELVGPKSRCGIDAVLRPGKGQTSFRDLLEPYEVQNAEPLEVNERDQLLRDIRRWADQLAGEVFRAEVEPMRGNDDTYTVTLRGEASLPIGGSARARPLSLKAGAVSMQATADGTETRFERVSFEAVTSFFVLELTLTRGGLTESAAFVIDAELIGAPSDRLSRLLTVELGTRRSVLRYLLLLLALGGANTDALLDGTTARGHGDGASDGAGYLGIPLFESLVRTLATEPQRLDAIDRLILDLERTAEGRELLPDDFLGLWQAFRAARAEVRQ
jgi:hypothetical protein